MEPCLPTTANSLHPLLCTRCMLTFGTLLYYLPALLFSLLNQFYHVFCSLCVPKVCVPRQRDGRVDEATRRRPHAEHDPL